MNISEQTSDESAEVNSQVGVFDAQKVETSKDLWTRRFFVCVGILCLLFTFGDWSIEQGLLIRRAFGALVIVVIIATIVSGLKILSPPTYREFKGSTHRQEKDQRGMFLLCIAGIFPIVISGLYIGTVLLTGRTDQLVLGPGGMVLAFLVPTLMYAILPMSIVALVVMGFWAKNLDKSYSSTWFIYAWSAAILLIPAALILLWLL